MYIVPVIDKPGVFKPGEFTKLYIAYCLCNRYCVSRRKHRYEEGMIFAYCATPLEKFFLMPSAVDFVLELHSVEESCLVQARIFFL